MGVLLNVYIIPFTHIFVHLLTLKNDSGEETRATNGTEDTQEDKVTTTDMRIKTQTCMLLQLLLSLELLESV